MNSWGKVAMSQERSSSSARFLIGGTATTDFE
jgi:hypothetical protein